MGWISWRRFVKVAVPLLAVWTLVAGVLVGPDLWQLHSQRNAPLNAFTGTSFAGDYTLDEDGGLKVTETVTVTFPPNTNHGINRDLPTRYRGREIHPADFAVTNEAGAPLPFVVNETTQNVSLRIGDPDTFASGTTTYKISYTYARTVQDFGDVQEFFWNINGDRWFQSFPSVSATIHLPAALASHRTGTLRCFDGNNDACQIAQSTTPDDTVITASAHNVGARSTMTVSVPFILGTVIDSGPDSRPSQLSTLLKFVFGACVLLLLGLALANITSRRRTLSGHSIVPEFEPPADLSPAGAAEFYGAPDRGVPAQLLDAVIKGEIRLTSDASGQTMAQVVDTVTRPPDAIGRASLALIRHGQNKGSAAFPVGHNLKRGIPRQRYIKARTAYLTSSSAPVSGPPGIIARAMDGFAGLGLVLIFIWTYRAQVSIWWTPAFAVLVALGYALLIRWITVKDLATFLHLEGMREYIGRADADRLAVLQSAETADRFGPDQEIDVYEKLLPWAVALGIEDTWREQIGTERLAGLPWFDASVEDVSSSSSSFRVGATAVGASAAAAGFSSLTSSGGGGGSGGGSSSSSGGSSGGGSGGGGGGGGGSGW